MEYAFTFDNHGTFTPSGRQEISDVQAHNKELERAEIDWMKSGQADHLFLYVKHPAKDDSKHGFQITTWLGTVLASDWNCVVGPRRNVGFGFRTYRRSVDCVIFGVRYVGWYMESSGEYCRLRKAKRQGR